MINILNQGDNSKNELTHIHKHRTAFIPTPVNGSQETALLACLWSAQQSLIKARTIKDAELARQNVKALEALSKEFKLSKEIQLDATELRIRAERRLGEMLKEIEKNKGARGALKGKDSSGGHLVVPPENNNPTLSNLGISKNDSSNFQRLASAEESIFESALADLREEAMIGRQSALSSTGVLRAVRKEQKGDKQPGFSSLIKPSDNWNFGNVRYGRIDEGVDEDWGYIPGELYINCFWYYVKPCDLVVVPMAGAGQAQRVYEARQEWMGNHAYDFDLKLFDLSPRGKYKDLICQHDVVKSFPINNPDYIVMDVPYYGMVAKQYSEKHEDLANMTLDEWVKAMAAIAHNCAQAQHEGKLCTVISPNYRDVSNRQIILTTDLIRQAWVGAGYLMFDKAYATRRIQQAQTPSMARMNNMAKERRVMLTDIAEILTFQRL